MFGLGMSEVVVVGIVALIVIGPKDLPGLFRTMGEFTGKARRMAREFSRAMEAAADEAGVKDVQNTIKAAADPKQFGLDKLKESTGMTKGPATQALSEERQAAKDKVNAAMDKAARERTAREEAEAEAPADAPKPSPEPKSENGADE